MTSNKDPFFDTRLLSRCDSPSIQEKELVLESVLLEKRKQEKQGVMKHFFADFLRSRVAGTIIVMLFLIPFGLFFFFSGQEDEFRRKGDDDAPFFSVTCFDSDGQTSCRRGTKLAFRLHRSSFSKDNLYFAAFNKSEADDTIYWCFPSDKTGESISIKGIEADGILPRGVLLNDSYKLGEYQTFGILSDAPLNRQQIRAIFDDPTSERGEAIRISSIHFSMEK